MSTATASQLRPDEIELYAWLALKATTTSRAWEAIQDINAYLHPEPTCPQRPEGAALLDELKEEGWTPAGEVRWSIIAYEETKALVRVVDFLGVETCEQILRIMSQPAIDLSHD